MAVKVGFLWTPQSLTIALFFLCLYIVSIVFYRLYFSPLAKFPGPKLAALTYWVEFYHDVLKRGQYTFEIVKMHEKYGPIVRITPDELHINDPNYYGEVYPGPQKSVEKHPSASGVFGNSGSIISTVPHNLHKMRRSPMNPLFSKRSVVEYSGSVVSTVDKLCARLEEFHTSQNPVDLRVAFSALTADVISQYCYGKSYDCLEKSDFDPDLYSNTASGGELGLLLKQCPWIFTIANSMPYWLIAWLNPKVVQMLDRRTDIEVQVQGIIDSKEKDIKGPSPSRSVFHELLNSDIPAEEKSLARLVDEGITLIGAGTVTSAHVLSTTTYHILANPEILQTLQTELQAINTHGSDQSTQPLLTRLEQLPYLTAIIKEGLRITHGIAHRNTRIAPTRALTYQSWTIPAGTAVSMNTYMLHTNATLFPEPTEFRPERWLQGGGGGEGGPAVLDKYLLPFGKGSRICLGIELAHAELYLALAAVFARFELRLFETGRADVDVAHDFVVGTPRLDSKGVRVLVRKRE